MDTLSALEKETRRYRRKRSAERYFSLLTAACMPGIVALLTMAFLSRLLWPPLIHALALVPLWILGVALRLLLSRGRWRLPLWKAQALADKKSGSLGTFMAVEETGDLEWPSRLGPREARLMVRFPWPGVLKWLAGAAAVTGVLLLPDLSPASGRDRPPAAPVTRIENMVAALKEENLVEEDFLEEIEEALEELKEDVDNSLDAADWQALDGMREDLEKKALDAYRQLMEARSEFQALREAIMKYPAGGDEPWKDTAESLAAMSAGEAAEFLTKAAETLGLDAKALEGLMERCRAGRFDFEQKQVALLEALSKASWLTPEQLKRLMKALEGLDLSKLSVWCEGMGLEALTPEEIERLLKMLEEGNFFFSDEDLENLKALCLGACQGCRMGAAACAGMLPGRGGISRGPGPAPLLGAGRTEQDFGGFEGKTFHGNLADPDVPLGFAYAPPGSGETEGEGRSDAAGPAIDFGSGEGRITWHSRLLPRHNDVMKKYFQEEKTP